MISGMVTGLLGGIGIFLVGMVLLTEGVKAAAGDAFRAMIQRFTRGPGTALISGAAVTALVQSSSATTLTTIGFVSAGLLTFPQAVGVIFGANLGTTSTGWLVSTIGFKVSLSAVAYPMVGLGALVRLLARGRTAQAGLAVAGFGLIFVGIEVLQGGMASLATRVDPGAFPGATLGGRVALVAVGVVMTVVMQSSSVAVATTLTGLHAGTLGLEQAALLVIGQNLGTTPKAALAAIGGSIPVRRTALAHILFNVVTGAVALAAFPLLLAGALRVAGEADPEIAIALFHTAFNVVGVMLLFPVLAPFSRFVERMVPEPEPALTRHLDPAVAQIPSVALEAARRSASAVSALLFARAAEVLTEPSRRGGSTADGVFARSAEALGEIRRFLAGLRTSAGDGAEHERHLSLLHATDHLERFLDALRDMDGRASAGSVGGLGPAQEALARALTAAPARGQAQESGWTAPGADSGDVATPDPDALEGVAATVAELRKTQRARVLEATALGEVDPGRAWHDIEALKTLDRLGYHAWRAAVHLSRADPGSGDSRSLTGETVPFESEVATEAFEDRDSGPEGGGTPDGQPAANSNVEQEFRTTEAKSGTRRNERDCPAS